MVLTLVAIWHCGGLFHISQAARLKCCAAPNQADSSCSPRLHSLIASDRKVLLFDVRQPLDLLAYPELILGAHRVPPQEVIDNPSLIPRDEDIVVYCTCPGDKTSRIILGRAPALGFTRIKFLTGGLAAWKTKGYPVDPYQESFRLSTPTVLPPAR